MAFASKSNVLSEVSHFSGGMVHHAYHRQAAAAYEADYHPSGQDEKKDIKDGCVVPLYALGNGDDVAVLWHKAQRLEEDFDDIARQYHRDVECHQNVAHNLPAIVFAVDVEDGQDNQIGKDEADNASETDAAAPENRRQRHIADRADKADDGYQWANQRPLDAGGHRVAAQEKGAPERFRHPGCQRTGDQQAQHDVQPDGSPVHHKKVADSGKTLGTEQF